jgi:hypothetical protein
MFSVVSFISRLWCTRACGGGRPPSVMGLSPFSYPVGVCSGAVVEKDVKLRVTKCNQSVSPQWKDDRTQVARMQSGIVFPWIG